MPKRNARRGTGANGLRLSPDNTKIYFAVTADGVGQFGNFLGGKIYTLPLAMSPTVYSATIAFFFAIVNTLKLVPFWFLGTLSVSNLELSAILIPFGLIGVGVGVYLVRRISARAFYAIAYVLILLLGIKILYDGITGVFFTGAA